MKTRRTSRRVKALCWAMVFVLQSSPAVAARVDGRLTITAIDEQTRQPIAVRMELRDARGRHVRVESPGVVSHGDYFVFQGDATLELRKGNYQFLIEAGPEYRTRPGHFSIDRHAEDQTEVVLQRRVDMQAEGWWAGDLDVRQSHQDLPLLMRAAGVDFAPTFVRENIHGNCRQETVPRELASGPQYSVDHRRGGVMFFQLGQSASSVDVCREKPAGSTLPLVASASEAGADVVALTANTWDLPLWIAHDRLDAIAILHRGQPIGARDEAGRPRDKAFYPGKLGAGRWSEAIYHHVLNCGLRIPPAAGSGSGANDAPVGASRVYVYCGEEFSLENWFAGLRAGQVTVTNGPLLRTLVEGRPPGHEFEIPAGQSRVFQIGLSLTFYEQAPVEYLEILKNGRVVHQIRLEELAQRQGRLPELSFDRSGWFAVRAITSQSDFYQYATTGPYYVVAGSQPRISRRSVQFFLDWLDEAQREFAQDEHLLTDILEARPFWVGLLEQANAE